MKARRKSIAQQGRMHVRRKLAEMAAEINDERQLKTRLKLSLQHANSERQRLEEQVQRVEGHYKNLEESYLNVMEDYMHMERAYGESQTRLKSMCYLCLDLQQERSALKYLLTKTRTHLINTSIIAFASGCAALAYLGLYIGVL